MSTFLEIHLDESAADSRLDRVLRRRYPRLPQGQIEKMCRKGDIRLDGERAKPATRVTVGQILRVPDFIEKITSTSTRKAAVPRLSDRDRDFIRSLVVYQDAYMIILNKPSGLAVQGGTKTHRHIDALAMGLCDGDTPKPQIVHRLDRDTSGLLVLGGDPQSTRKLAEMFRTRRVQKIYWALVAGAVSPKLGRIELGLYKATSQGGGRGEGEKMYTISHDRLDTVLDAKPAITDYMTLETAGNRLSWLALSPVTGRTHQIRAHMGALGHPIIGDGKYGGGNAENKGDGWGGGIGGAISNLLHLHARALRFIHPVTNKEMVIYAALPEHMRKTWDLLGWAHARDDHDYDARALEGFPRRKDF